MIDQHALTGESTPAEKGVGDRVFAATVMVAGKIYVEVEKAGSDTASAEDQSDSERHSRIQTTRKTRASGSPTRRSSRRWRWPASAWRRWGPAGAVAILNSDFGTGIRMAAPLAMLSSLAVSRSQGHPG